MNLHSLHRKITQQSESKLRLKVSNTLSSSKWLARLFTASIYTFLASPPTYRETTARLYVQRHIALKWLASIGSHAEHQCQRTENTSFIKGTHVPKENTEDDIRSYPLWATMNSAMVLVQCTAYRSFLQWISVVVAAYAACIRFADICDIHSVWQVSLKVGLVAGLLNAIE